MSAPKSTACVCYDLWDPYCCKGSTYSNDCNAECDGLDIDKDCVSGECSDSCICNTQWDPYCCDETTFGNSCNALCQGWNVTRHTECDQGTCAPTMQPTTGAPTTVTEYFMTTSDGSWKYHLIALCISFMMGLY